MSTPIPCTDCTGISGFHRRGFSPDFELLQERYEKVVEDFKNAETTGRPQDNTLSNLNRVFQEYSMDNWDGYNAKKISKDAYFEAGKFIQMLPFNLNLHMPDITPEPDGSVSLEWYRGPERLFAISLSGDNEIIFSGILGSERIRGAAYFGTSIPKRILESVQDIFFER